MEPSALATYTCEPREVAVDAEMEGGIQPITPANDGAPGQFVSFSALCGRGGCFRPKIVMGEVVLVDEWGESMQE